MILKEPGSHHVDKGVVNQLLLMVILSVMVSCYWNHLNKTTSVGFRLSRSIICLHVRQADEHMRFLSETGFHLLHCATSGSNSAVFLFNTKQKPAYKYRKQHTEYRMQMCYPGDVPQAVIASCWSSFHAFSLKDELSLRVM